MYMDILEQEVEDLGAEVMRLRLMVQRVSQVMGPPILGRHQSCSHVDPLHAAPPSTATDAGTPADLQVTVDSCKQMLPLLQLLLAQQRSDAEVSLNQRSRHSPRHRHQRRNRRHAPSRSTDSSSSRSSQSVTSSRRQSPTSPATSLTKYSSHHRRKKQVRHLLPHKAARPSSTSSSSSSSQKPIVIKGDVQKRRMKSTTAQLIGQTPVDMQRRKSAVSTRETRTRDEPLPVKATALTTIPASVVDRLRAQRERDAVNEQEGSLGSGKALLIGKSQTRSVVTSSSASTPCRMYVMSTSTVNSARKGEVQAMESVVAASQRRASLRTAEMSHFSPSTDRLVSQASRVVPESPVPSTNGFMDTIGLQHSSVANSIIHSEQGIYSYSALQSACDSPASSHVLEDAVAATTATEVTSTALQTPEGKASSVEQNRKLLPLQTSALSYAQERASSASNSSAESSKGSTAEVQNALQTIIPTPYRAGVILGAHRPISVQSMTSPSASVLTGTSFRGGESFRTAAAVPGLGGGANATPQMNLLPIPSDRNGSTSSLSDNAAFLVPRPRQTTAAYHRDSSFHNCSDAESSRPPLLETGSRSPQQHSPDRSASQSQEAYSFASSSMQYSAQHSPRQQEVHASPNTSRVLSNSINPHESAQSFSLASPEVSHQGFMATGGYYYGYNFGIGSSSQPSISSSPFVEA